MVSHQEPLEQAKHLDPRAQPLGPTHRLSWLYFTECKSSWGSRVFYLPHSPTYITAVFWRWQCWETGRWPWLTQISFIFRDFHGNGAERASRSYTRSSQDTSIGVAGWEVLTAYVVRNGRREKWIDISTNFFWVQFSLLYWRPGASAEQQPGVMSCSSLL